MKTPSLEQLKSLAKDRAKAHSTYLKKLSKKPPKDLDYRVQEIHDEVFEEVDCLSCANRCKMKEAAFTDTYLRLDEDNDWVLKELPCPFLAHDNYCNIYEVRPKACREYPHTDRKKFHQIRSLTLKNTSICPAAFKVVERMLERIPIS